MFNQLGLLAPPAGPFQLKSAYDFFFGIYIASTDSWLYDWFNDQFGITFEEIEIEPGVTVEVAFYDLLNYVSFQAFKLTDDYTCPLPCPFTTDPFELPA